MIGRPARRQPRHPLKSKIAKIKLLDKDIDHPNRIVITDPILQIFRK